MAPYTNIPLSPAELSYLHSSLAQTPPIRPDGRGPSQFRPLVAETEILPSANGSARICFADGTEAVVGVKAEVERSRMHAGSGGAEDESGEVAGEGVRGSSGGGVGKSEGDVDMDDESEEGEGGVSLSLDGERRPGSGKGQAGWVEFSIEIPGMRDDDAMPVFLAAMLTEALTADGELKDRLWINARFHWRLYVDILLLSQTLSYPLPLLSLTTHLALLSTRLPALISEKDEDPLFNDDWEASTYLYPRSTTSSTATTKTHTGLTSKPPITLLIMTVNTNIIFDPSHAELAVADAVFAISAVRHTDGTLGMISLRTVDPPSRLTAAGVPTALNSTAGAAALSASEALALRERDQGQTVWRPPRGGVSRQLVARMIKMVVERGGVGEEVLGGLEGAET